MKNLELMQFMREAKQELKYTVPHRRGIILGYHKTNLDALLHEGIICESERQTASFELDEYYKHYC
jgi:hypothetical protein